MEENIQQAERIQTSILNGAERKALVAMAKRMPRWVNSDMMTALGMLGAALTGLGFYLTRYDIGWLWLSSGGLLVNWFGDSMDGTLARVRHAQRPLYGYYVDHIMDIVNEAFMFIGAGLSPLLHFDLAMAVFILYLFMTINVSINAHLRGEFRLTYAKLGPTEFRLVIILANMVLVCCPALAGYGCTIALGHRSFYLLTLDFVALPLVLALGVIFLCTVWGDARTYARLDPPRQH